MRVRRVLFVITRVVVPLGKDYSRTYRDDERDHATAATMTRSGAESSSRADAPAL